MGAKLCNGDVIIICCPEIYHFDNSIDSLVKPFKKNKKLMTIPNIARDDISKKVLDFLNGVGKIDRRLFRLCKDLKHTLPFCMGLDKKTFMEIGGYDEDFVGFAWEDIDLVSRLVTYGCQYSKVPCSIIHLWHKRGTSKGGNYHEKIKINRQLYEERINIIKRNEGKKWGNCEKLEI